MTPTTRVWSLRLMLAVAGRCLYGSDRLKAGTIEQS